MSDCACPGSRARYPVGSFWKAPRRDEPLSGVINVDKPAGMTSHDVVDAVRGMAGQRQVGHSGTLDPLATGVLLVCLGSGTRIAEYLQASKKRYRATFLLGATSDTYDAEGVIQATGGRCDFSVPEIQSVLEGFLGHILQVPPLYSAIKQNGRPLHRLARQGKTVERTARPVEIEELVIVDWTSPALVVEVACSPGTYVRSLAHDVGQVLGCGAYLASLVRTASGRFTLEQAVSLSRLQEAFMHGQEAQFLLPVDEALIDWPALVFGPDDAQRICRGQLPREMPPPSEVAGGSLARAYSVLGDFLGILSYHAETATWRPKKVFAGASPAAGSRGSAAAA